MRQPNDADKLEILGQLYLRLNGFFVTPFLIHARAGVAGQIDNLGFRGKFHNQDERNVALELAPKPNFNDLVILECKNNNPRLQNYARRDADIAKILKWSGLCPPDLVDQFSKEIARGLGQQDAVSSFECEQANLRFQYLLLSNDERNDNGLKVILAKNALSFAHQCLRPDGATPDCARNYGALQWGWLLERVVEWLKGANEEDITVENFYRQL